MGCVFKNVLTIIKVIRRGILFVKIGAFPVCLCATPHIVNSPRTKSVLIALYDAGTGYTHHLGGVGHLGRLHHPAM